MIWEKVRLPAALPIGLTPCRLATPWDWMADPRKPERGFDFDRWKREAARLDARGGPLVIDFEEPVKEIGRGDYYEQLRDLLIATRDANPALRIGAYGVPTDEMWASEKWPHHQGNAARVATHNRERAEAGLLSLCDFAVPPAWWPDGVEGDRDAGPLFLDEMQRQAKRCREMHKRAMVIIGARTVKKAELLTCERFRAMLDAIGEAYSAHPFTLDGVALFIHNKEDGGPDDWRVIEPHVRTALAWADGVNAERMK